MIESIFLYKLIAAFLITNSHMGPLYGRFDALALGGALGNTFFFIASGFLASKKRDSFFTYMKKRVIRIWPSVVVVTVIMYIMGELPEYETVGEMLSACIFPTAFWFVNAVIVCYILLYFVNSYFEKYQTQIVFGFLFAYLFYYLLIFDLKTASLESGYGKVLYLFPAMIIGKKMKMTYTLVKKKAFQLWGWTGMASIIWLFLQLVSKRHPMLQILVPFSSIALGVFLLELLLYHEDRITELNSRIKTIIHEIANATLEIYLVQVVIIRYMANHLQLAVIPATFILIFGVAVIMRKILNVKR